MSEPGISSSATASAAASTMAGGRVTTAEDAEREARPALRSRTGIALIAATVLARPGPRPSTPWTRPPCSGSSPACPARSTT
jgi:hypothetical protein